jgi:thiol:disulfide interchange protein DsbD
MKNIIIILVLILSTNVFSQIHDPVKWSTSVKSVSETEYELIVKADIEGEWHLYSQTVPEDGPIPTSFVFEGNANYLKKGNTKEDKGHVINDPVFNMQIKYFGENATFKQRIKLKSKAPFKINAVVEYMVCNDRQCLAPKEVDLVFDIK